MADMNEGRRVAIRLPDGVRLSVTPEQYHRQEVGPKGETYERLGATVLGWEDGETYDPATSRQIKAELREERKATEEREKPKAEPKRAAPEPKPEPSKPEPPSRAAERVPAPPDDVAVAKTEEKRG